MHNQYFFCSEQQLINDYQTIIQPFWHDVVQQGQFTGTDEIIIAYAYALHPNPIGSIVISSGRIESYIKYKEIIYDLYQNGYSVFIHDHRGQGLSGRMTDNSHMGYVNDFSDYLKDFRMFMDSVVTPNCQVPPKLLCHSMGGAIGALMILAHPTWFDKVAFSAPMFGIRPALPNWFAAGLFKWHFTVNKQTAYFTGQTNYINQPFVGNDLTHSEVRYRIFRQEYADAPHLQLGGVTGNWLKAATQAMDEIEQQVKNFPISALVLQAGADSIVDNKRQRRIANNMTNTSLTVIEGAKHELLEEQDSYRVLCLTTVLDFFRP